MTSLELAKTVAGILDAKKAEQVSVIGIEDISALCDYFVIATGTSNTHVRALTDEVEHQLKEMDIKPDHTEGYRSNSWILMDYDRVVVHVFVRESREFYDLDRLWKDGKVIPLDLIAD